VLTKDGLPSTDPREAREKGGFLTSLGGAPETSSYKGYGLAAMVNILCSCLSGATLITDPVHAAKPNIGHFFMAIDPGLFRDRREFQADVARFCSDLRATKPIDPGRPVMVAGDPQWQIAAKRGAEGVPVGPGLLAQLRQLAQASAAPWLLD
jgi:LDH2 family malate/lactate/ureidoglycolate dehydrogenase